MQQFDHYFIKTHFSRLQHHITCFIYMDVNDFKSLGHKKKSILCFLCFVFHFPSLYAISFNYSNFSNNTGIKKSHDAFITSNGILSLTSNIQADLNSRFSVGRAVYAEEMHLWDAGTGQIADFTTHFSFNITKLPGGTGGDGFGADGFTFFLSPNGAQAPEGAWGQCLALITNCQDFKKPENPIVAVEFDTYKNYWDQNDNHVGIDINSIQSVTWLPWDTSLKNGSRANAWISYNSQTSNLSLFLTYLDNPVFLGNSSLSYEVNLSNVLPEWVSVGFSAATGTRFETHYILSWEFNSTELISGQGEDAIPPTSNNGNKAQGGANIGVVIGSVVGGLVLVGGIISTLVFGLRKRSRKAEDQESTVEADDHSIDNEFEHGMGPKRFSYGEVACSTNNFSEEGKLGMLKNPYDRHEINRLEVTQVICSVCDTEQPVARVCTNCGVNMGEYFCEICKFYDDDGHAIQLVCMIIICAWRIPCGITVPYVMSCRICSKSIIDMSRTWKRIDEEDSLAEEAKAKFEEMEPDREARKKLCTSFLKGRLRIMIIICF
ncbi:hypothetical protein LWI28_014193 [Acer negundo]|uniref:CHY-type domain-containing protein n=1 Tax=Acer negundo TaxID=4023 RepID=A0AAD5JEB3_ACENE|nr:hypothetical protein LWI28_014193 [Acer negundo]